jgi:Na+/proline symporter
MLSYFGCDQSQVQRYLAAKSADEGSQALLMSAYFKIPLQALILLLGVFVFVFYLFQQPPMLFNPVYENQVRASGRANDYAAIEAEFDQAFQERRRLAAALAASAADERAAEAFRAADRQVADIRGRAASLVRDVTGDRAYQDVNYVFPTFVTTHLPIGLVGLFIAAIFAAAMSSIAAELNALSTATVIDFYRRHFNSGATDAHYLQVSKLATGFWGVFACGIAMYATALGSLIEVVNRFGSFFYGSILGVFILAIGFRSATGNGAFVGLIAGMASVAWFASFTRVAFLWHNVIGAVVVLIVGLAVSAIDPRRRRVGAP